MKTDLMKTETFIKIKKGHSQNSYLLAVMSFVTHPCTFSAAAEGLEQTTGTTLKDILNTSHCD